MLMVLVTHLSAAEPDAVIISTFDTDADGWTVSGNNPTTGGVALPPDWVPTGGNPGGFIQEQDQRSGAWYWQAPTKFRGSKSTYYDGTLFFDLQQNDPTRQFSAPDVILQGGPTGNRINLQYDTTANPAAAPAWTRYEVPLRADGTWLNVTQGITNAPIATENDMRTVLSRITTLRIRGEYRDDPVGTERDIGGLDNAALAGPGETLPTQPTSTVTTTPTATATTVPTPTATTAPSPTATTAPPLQRVYLPLVVK
jgi:hypothetical protein